MLKYLNDSNNKNNNIPSIFGCPCLPINDDELEKKINYFINNKLIGYTVAINAEKILNYNKDPVLRDIIDNSILPYPDGAGAVIGMKWLNSLECEKVNMPIRILEIANKNNLTLFVVGAKELTHIKALDRIKIKYPHIIILGSMHGYHTEQELINSIKSSSPDIIMIALGTPRQEKFASKLKQHLHSGVMVGCGGALDIISGELKRAPEFFINNNLEWAYRLAQEPWRWKRQLFLPKFFFKLLLSKLFLILNIKK